MPGRDRKIAPETGDYIDDGNGSWETTTTLETAVRHQILTELGRWCGDPGAGSEFYRFRRARNSEIETRRAAEVVRRALNPFVDLGLARDVKVTVERDAFKGWTLSGSLVDTQHGDLDITPLLPFGG